MTAAGRSTPGEVDVAVLGGGLAGLAAARGLQSRGMSCVVLEAAEEAGGLARSFEVDGYTFDCSGHLLHLAHPEIREIVLAATPGQWHEIERHSSIVLRDRLIPYPFQMHLGHAPDDVRDECVAALPADAREFDAPGEEVNFADWIDGSLGPGIGKHFMVPYNEKLTTVEAAELTCEWLGRFVPRPSVEQIREGAASKRVIQTGYNQRFLYPKEGGISLLWKVLASEVRGLSTGARVAQVDTADRVISLASGEKVRYREGVISSLPLPEMARLVRSGDSSPAAAGKLRANSVTCVNVGVKRMRRDFDELQWLYLPEDRFTAYRLGLYTRFAPSMAPEGREGLYVEIAHGPGASERDLARAALDDLVELGAIRGEEDVDVVLPVHIDHAYVIHDFACAPGRRALHAALREQGIHMIGRYGRWEYAAMEDAIRQGLDAPAALLQEAAVS